MDIDKRELDAYLTQSDVDATDNLVTEDWACPNCGERDADVLEITDEDAELAKIHCWACGASYTVRQCGEEEE